MQSIITSTKGFAITRPLVAVHKTSSTKSWQYGSRLLLQGGIGEGMGDRSEGVGDVGEGDGAGGRGEVGMGDGDMLGGLRQL